MNNEYPFDAIRSVSDLTSTDLTSIKKYLTNDTATGEPLSQHSRIANDVVPYSNNRISRQELPDWMTPPQISLVEALVNDLAATQLGVFDEDFIALSVTQNSFSTPGKLILIGADVILDTLQQLFRPQKITVVEQRLLSQLVCGYSLRECSDMDNIGFETRRKQLKTLFEKTGFRRQMDLVNHVLSHLLIRFGTTPPETQLKRSHLEFIKYCDDYLADARFHIVVGLNGQQYRILDFGSRTGTTAILLHHGGIIHFTTDEISILSRLNIRLVCPLRNGALAPTDNPMLRDDHLAHAMSGIQLAQATFCCEKATIICCLSSCFYGLEYASRHPESVSKLIFLGATYLPLKKKTAGSILRHQVFGLALNNQWLLNKLTHYITARSQGHSAIRSAYTKAYQDNPADVAILDANFDDPETCDAYVFRIRNSVQSLQHDLYHQAGQQWSQAKELTNKMHFFHGELDNIHPVNTIEQFVCQLHNATLHKVPNAGALIYHEHLPAVLARVAALVE